MTKIGLPDLYSWITDHFEPISGLFDRFWKIRSKRGFLLIKTIKIVQILKKLYHPVDRRKWFNNLFTELVYRSYFKRDGKNKISKSEIKKFWAKEKNWAREKKKQGSKAVKIYYLLKGRILNS